MIESKPVEANGLEFVAAIESEWVSLIRMYGETPVQIQLFIHNTTKEPLLFSTFDSFFFRLKNAQGNDIIGHSGRDATLWTKSVIIDAGSTYCLSRKAVLDWNDDKLRTLTYYDGTGTVSLFTPLPTGNYTLLFYAHSEKSSPKDGNLKIKQWIGNAVTGEVPFKIVEP